MVFVQLDPVGITVIAVEVAGFVLLLLGVFPSKSRGNALNLVRHGFFSSLSTAVTLVAVFVVMAPFFFKIVDNTSAASFTLFPIMWLHVVVGVVALSSSVIMIASWIGAPLSQLGCARRWRLMKPTLAIWAMAIVLGAVIHVLGLR
jgi:hypothetical protein